MDSVILREVIFFAESDDMTIFNLVTNDGAAEQELALLQLTLLMPDNETHCPPRHPPAGVLVEIDIPTP